MWNIFAFMVSPSCNCLAVVCARGKWHLKPSYQLKTNHEPNHSGPIKSKVPFGKLEERSQEISFCLLGFVSRVLFWDFFAALGMPSSSQISSLFASEIYVPVWFLPCHSGHCSGVEWGCRGWHKALGSKEQEPDSVESAMAWQFRCRSLYLLLLFWYPADLPSFSAHSGCWRENLVHHEPLPFLAKLCTLCPAVSNSWQALY